MKKHLLIIEDNTDVIEIISVILLDLFDSVNSAQTIDEALNCLGENTYTLVFLDINIVNRNGAEVLKFLIDNPDNPNVNAHFVVMSGSITPGFVDRHHKKFAGILMKPFEHDDIRQITEQIIAPKVVKTLGGLDENPIDKLEHLVCDLPVPIIQLEKRVKKILEKVKNSVKLNQLITTMEIDRGEHNYFLAHVNMLVNITSAICIQLGWDSDKTLEQFIYAAYLHDMALVDRLDLIRMGAFDSLEKQKESLSPADYKLVLEHPNIAANSIKNVPGIPPHVEMIIRQHHEHPMGIGYPTKCGYQKIVPFASVFIVAHDLTDYILLNPKWNTSHPRQCIENYTAQSLDKFHGPHFSKIFRILPLIE